MSHFGSKLEAQEAPQTSKIQPQTQKNRSLKTTRFWHRFWKGLALVLEGFLVGFWTKNACQKRTPDFCEKLTKHCVGAWNLRFGSCNKPSQISKNPWKIACFLRHRFWRHFGWILEGFWEAKIYENHKSWLPKIHPKCLQNRCPKKHAIFHRFLHDFGAVLGAFWEAKIYDFRDFFQKMEAKNKMIFGSLKNRILRPQKQTADEARRSVRIRGKEHRMGGRHLN